MAVTINKEFWNTTDTQWDSIEKIVFTSPNIESPAQPDARSHILPGSEYIATWYQSISNLHRINNRQNTFTNRLDLESKVSPTFIAETLTTGSGLDFNSALSVVLDTNKADVFTLSGTLYYDDNNYATIDSIGSYSAVTSGGSLNVILPDSSSPWVQGNSDLEYIWWTVDNISRYEVVDVYISYNNGSTWLLAAEGITNDGMTPIVPLVTSIFAKVKVVYNGQEAISDAFNIVAYEAPYTPDPNYSKRIIDPDYTSAESTYTDPAALTWFDGTDIIYKIAIGSTSFYKYTISTNTWSETAWSTAPGVVTEQGSFVIEDNKVYLYQGYDGSDFYVYNIATNNWTALTNPPINVYFHSYMDTLGESDTIYIMDNASDYILYKYTISTDIWSIAFEGTRPAGTTTVGPYFWKDSGNYYTFTENRVDYGSYNTVSIYSLQMPDNTTTYVDQYRYDDSNYSNLKGTYGAKGTHGIFITSATKYVNGVFEDSGTMACNVDGTQLSAPDRANFWYSIDNLFGGITNHYSYSVVASGTNFYLNLRTQNVENDIEDSYMFRYTTGVSGLGSQCYIPANDTLLPDENTAVSMTVFDNKLYIPESGKSNKIWYSTVTSGSVIGDWHLMGYTGLTDTTYTDDIYFVHNSTYITSDPTYMWLVEGLDTYGFYRSTGEAWTVKNTPPGPFKEYFNMDYHTASNSHFAIQGQDSKAFWKYNVAGNTWTVLDDLPSTAEQRGSVKVIGDYVYYKKGGTYSLLYRYDINTPGWIVIDDFPGDNADKLCWEMTSSGTQLRLVSQYSTYTDESIIYSYDTVGATWLLDEKLHIDPMGLPLNTVGDDRYLYTLVDSETAGGYSKNHSVWVYGLDIDNALSDSASNDNYNPESGTPPGWFSPGAVTSGTTTYNVTLTLDNVIGTTILPADSTVYNWIPTVTDALVQPLNTILFEITNGEAYSCRLTAWDDETHTTTTNKILDEGHYKVACVAYKAGDGTKEAPLEGDISDFLVHAPASDLVLKGNTSYYGDFDLIYVANGGDNTTSHGEYLLFQPILDEMDETFTSGNYDFITTLHYQYT